MISEGASSGLLVNSELTVGVSLQSLTALSETMVGGRGLAGGILQMPRFSTSYRDTGIYSTVVITVYSI